ncbi:MAG TPA: hypothetical protein VIF12_05970 [Micavibrio sp.]|jgi:hypothetical protein
MFKWLNKILNRTPELQGKSLDHLAFELKIPELPEIYPVRDEVRLYTYKKGDSEETLCILPHYSHGDGFAIVVNWKSSGITPTIRLDFKEVAKGRFKADGCTINLDKDDNPILPSEYSIPPIRAVRQALLDYRSKQLRKTYD